MGAEAAAPHEAAHNRSYLRDRFRSAFNSEDTLSKVSSSGSKSGEKALDKALDKALAAGGSADPFAARNGLLENKFFHAIVIWVVAAAFLWLLKPPLICRTRSDDDLDGFRCSWGRILAWSSLAPASYFLLPKLTT